MDSMKMKIPARRVYAIIAEMVGAPAIDIIKALKGKSNISEFVLAEGLNREINVVRNLLYKLYDLNLVSFTRKKDQKKGWYIHYWTFNANQVRFLIIRFLKNKIERIGDRLTRETSSQFYMCDNKCIRFTFEQGVDFGFKCPECGVLLELEDNRGTIETLKLELKGLEKELTEVAI